MWILISWNLRSAHLDLEFSKYGIEFKKKRSYAHSVLIRSNAACLLIGLQDI